MLKDFLQGKWLGHPLHPALVHLPTGAFPAALVLDLISRAGDGSDAAVLASFWCIAIALLGVLAAAPTGLADWAGIKKGKPAWTIGLIHAGLNVLVALIFLINLILRFDTWREDRAVGDLPLALSIVGNVILLVSGWLGTRMVFNWGISVARLSKEKWRGIAEAGGVRLPESGED
jgi:uncharacterized membrane protein